VFVLFRSVAKDNGTSYASDPCNDRDCQESARDRNQVRTRPRHSASHDRPLARFGQPELPLGRQSRHMENGAAGSEPKLVNPGITPCGKVETASPKS
jgi:hypothetical protein